MRFLTSLLVLLIFFFGLLFLVQNKEVLSTPLELKLDLYFTSADIPFLDKIKGTPPAEAEAQAVTAKADRFVWQTKEGEGVPFFFVLICSFALGMLFCSCFFLLSRIRMGYQLMAKKRAVHKLQKEVDKLKEEREQTVLETQALTPSKQLPAPASESDKEQKPETA